MKAKIVTDGNGKLYGIRVNCEYCVAHVLPVRWVPEGMSESPAAAGKPHWDFHGEMERPTFHPSIQTSWEANGVAHVCHSYMRGGRIEYLPDCTHQLAGQVRELVDVEAPVAAYLIEEQP